MGGNSCTVMFAETHSGCQTVSAEGFDLLFLCAVDFCLYPEF